MKTIMGLFLIILVVACAPGVDKNVKSCLNSGSDGETNYCGNTTSCEKGVPFIIAQICVENYAEKVASTDKNKAENICEYLGDLTERHFDLSYGEIYATQIRYGCLAKV